MTKAEQISGFCSKSYDSKTGGNAHPNLPLVGKQPEKLKFTLLCFS